MKLGRPTLLEAARRYRPERLHWRLPITVDVSKELAPQLSALAEMLTLVVKAYRDDPDGGRRFRIYIQREDD